MNSIAEKKIIGNVITPPASSESEQAKDVDLEKLRRDIQHTVGYFEGLDTELIAIIEKLRKFQQVYPRLKFHMFMETETDSLQCPGTSFRVLYSPTIVLSDESHKPLVNQITSGLSLLSALSETTHCTPKAEQITGKSIFNITTLPAWFPGTIDNGPDDQPLVLDESVAARFETLSPTIVTRVYELFFQEAFECVKRNCRGRLKGIKVKVYESFTAPWYRRVIKVGYRTNTAESRLLQNKRQLRQQLGRQRMAWTLASFYQFEAAFSRGALEYLLRNASEIPGPTRQSGRRLKIPMTTDPVSGNTVPAELTSSASARPQHHIDMPTIAHSAARDSTAMIVDPTEMSTTKSAVGPSNAVTPPT